VAGAQVPKLSLVPPRAGFGKTLPTFAGSVDLFKAEPEATLQRLVSGVRGGSPCSRSGLAGSG